MISDLLILDLLSQGRLRLVSEICALCFFWLWYLLRLGK